MRGTPSFRSYLESIIHLPFHRGRSLMWVSLPCSLRSVSTSNVGMAPDWQTQGRLTHDPKPVRMYAIHLIKVLCLSSRQIAQAKKGFRCVGGRIVSAICLCLFKRSTPLNIFRHTFPTRTLSTCNNSLPRKKRDTSVHVEILAQ